MARPKQHGVTLIEAVTATILVGVLAIVGVNLVADSMTLSKRASAQNYNASSARYAMDRLAREIREAKTIYQDGLDSTKTTNPFLKFESSASQYSRGSNATLPDRTLIFTCDPQKQTFTFQTLAAKNSGTTADASLLKNVKTCKFTYYNRFGIDIFRSGAASSEQVAANVHSIGITLATQDADSPTVTLNTEVFLRN